MTTDTRVRPDARARRVRLTAPRTPDGHGPTGPQRVFALSFSGTGLVVAAFFFALSLLPSLLPRAAIIQGVVSGLTVAIGYGLGAGSQSIWDYLRIPKPTGQLRRIIVAALTGLIAVVVLYALWSQVGWQNEIRELFGMEPVSPATWPTILPVALITAVVLLIIGRSLRVLFNLAARWLSRRLPARLAWALGVSVLLALFWLLLTGVAVNAFFAGASSVFSVADGDTPEGYSQPQDAERSGSPASASSWDSLGRQGRVFTGGGPTAAQIDEFSGGGAKVPIRAYVGLRGGDTLEDRAQLLLDELKRTGAFDREVLVVATTTGTGWLDPFAVDSLEYAHNGDTAIAGVQYSFLPSWISLLADQQAVRDTSREVFGVVHAYWSTLPEESRPKLYLYGLSLGSFGVESILTSINIVNEPIDGALMTGPPFLNDLHSQLVADRDPGTAPWQPTFEAGRTVRFTAEESGFANTPGPWGPTKLIYLQHNSDPVVFFSPRLAFAKPDWLKDGQSGPDISPQMGWFPIVTMWQVLMDLPAGGIPAGFGHTYTYRANLECWVQMTSPPDWTDAKTETLLSILEARDLPSD